MPSPVPGYAASMLVSDSFREGLLKMARLLGIGRMYNICGHFHADLGIFESSKIFETYVIGVAGFQPRKCISRKGTTYIIECNVDKTHGQI